MTNDLTKLHADVAEGYVIGGLIVNPGVWDEVAAIVDPSDFRLEDFRKAFEAIGARIEEGKDVDSFLIEGDIGVVNGSLLALASNVPSFMHLKGYAEKVHEFSVRRNTVDISRETATAAYDLEQDIQEARLHGATLLQEGGGAGEGAVHVTEWLEDGEKLLVEWRDNPRDHAGFTTGLGDLDKVFGDGLLPGMNLLLGEPGLGKSILAQQIALEQVKNKIPVAFYSAEMMWRDMYLRLISSESKVKVSSMRRGDYWDGDWTKIEKAGGRLGKLPLFVSDPQNMTTVKLRADLARLKAEHGIKVVVFDYLGKLRDLTGVYKDEWKRTTEIAYRLQPILVSLDLAGLIVHQTNKEGFGRPNMSGIQGGGGVAYEAVCAVQIVAADQGDFRKVINIKPPRGVEGYWSSCLLYKDPLVPKFGLGPDANMKEMYDDYTV